MAKMLGKTDLPVVLDDKPELFQAGPVSGTQRSTAAGTAWGKYVDAFQWNRGSVAYHIASSEAVSLHNRGGEVLVQADARRGEWRRRWGPVAEPYLVSFSPGRTTSSACC